MINPVDPGSASLAQPELNAIVCKERQPDHLFPLRDPEWAVWRWAGLRGAGIGVREVSALADSGCALSADLLIQAQDAFHDARNEALDYVKNSQYLLKQEQGEGDREKRARLRRAANKIEKGKLPGPVDCEAVRPELLERLRSASSALESAHLDFVRHFEDCASRTSLEVRRLAASSRFREAVIWQNRNAYHTAVLPLLRKAEDDLSRNTKDRQHEELVANYLQRYCTKNESIGFFGPVGWARLREDGQPVEVKPGPGLVAERNSYFEVWCIDALAEALSKRFDLMAYFAPSLAHYVYLDGERLLLPSRPPVQVAAVLAAILSACDGRRSAKQIAEDLLRGRKFDLKDQRQVYELLRLAREKGFINWKAEVPLGLRPEMNLRAILEQVDDESVRSEAESWLRKIESARDLVAAAGEPDELDAALDRLDSSFHELTGVAPTRANGQTYAARTILYEDCRRDVEVTIGSALIKELGGPLSLLLKSARWFTCEVARLIRGDLESLYKSLVEKTGATSIDCSTFWYRMQTLIYRQGKTPFRVVQEEFQRRWAEALALPEGERRVAIDPEELKARVDAAFAAGSAGWQGALYHSPDVMIRARSKDAILSGQYQFVLGELHLAANTLRTALFLAQHASPEELLSFVEEDFPAPRLVPMQVKGMKRVSGRLINLAVPERDYRLIAGPDAVDRCKWRVIPVANMVVESGSRGLILKSRDGGLQFDFIDALSDVLTGEVAGLFKQTEKRRHTPRVTVGRLVMIRESWSLPACDMGFGKEKGRAERFLAARRWAREHGMPRFVFVKVPVEIKPFYVDFDSPLYVDILAKLVRKTYEETNGQGVITVSEMLPRPDEVWLHDREGNNYTSELRIVAVDRLSSQGR